MFDRQSLYITALGELGTGGGGGEDIFSFGLRATGVVGFDAAAALEQLDVPTIAGIVGGYFGDPATMLSDRAHLYSVKVGALGQDGKYLVSSREAEPSPGGVSGGLTEPDYPNQIALCISTGTATTIGHAVRGRFYLPLPAHSMTMNGRITISQQNSTADRTQTFMNAMNVKLQLDLSPDAALSIMSNIGAGTTRGITNIRVGDVLDTIRSRRNALQETYVVKTVTV